MYAQVNLREYRVFYLPETPREDIINVLTQKKKIVLLNRKYVATLSFSVQVLQASYMKRNSVALKKSMHGQQRNLGRWDENKSAAELDIAIRSLIYLPRKGKNGAKQRKEMRTKKCKPTSFLPVSAFKRKSTAISVIRPSSTHRTKRRLPQARSGKRKKSGETGYGAEFFSFPESVGREFQKQTEAFFIPTLRLI
ncbi:hypothetical protein CEXT_647911 [Caerostris extrusa]|uniref:Uncharacterized protein n=1 Tax=Caerostris extrusa TaxID=172846 RepID=A0AAV4PZA1_CAEEX|nr:hypothetical protein CEXT_647911 [Caerostris extrusa]